MRLVERSAARSWTRSWAGLLGGLNSARFHSASKALSDAVASPVACPLGRGDRMSQFCLQRNHLVARGEGPAEGDKSRWKAKTSEQIAEERRAITKSLRSDAGSIRPASDSTAPDEQTADRSRDRHRCSCNKNPSVAKPY
jgi:hypothetical protein